MKDYLIHLDNDNFGYGYLWNSTIKKIQEFSIRIEIVSVSIPIIIARTEEAGYEFIKNIKGIKTIEEDNDGYLD